MTKQNTADKCQQNKVLCLNSCEGCPGQQKQCGNGSPGQQAEQALQPCSLAAIEAKQISDGITAP